MKTGCLFVFAFLLAGLAQGQTSPKYEPTLMCTCAEFSHGEADGNGFSNGSSPNCGKPAKGKQYIATCWDTKADPWGNEGNGGADLPTYPLGQPVVVENQMGSDETDFLPNGVWPYTPQCPDGYRYGGYDQIHDRWEGDCVPEKPAEHIDVPAVQVKDERCENHPGLAGGDGHVINCSPSGKRYTCDPKSRILMHDENNPPRYWCHKVEP